MENNNKLKIEELYSGFVFSTINYYNEQLKLTTPENMYDEYSARQTILSLMSDFCVLYRNNSVLLFDIFKNWVVSLKDNSEYFNEEIESIFDFLGLVSNVAVYENIITKWFEQHSYETGIIKESDMKELNPGK